MILEILLGIWIIEIAWLTYNSIKVNRLKFSLEAVNLLIALKKAGIKQKKILEILQILKIDKEKLSR